MAGKQTLGELRARALSDLEWPEVCARLASHCASDVAREVMLELEPEGNADAARLRAQLSQAALDAEGADAPLPRVCTPDVLEALEGLASQRALTAQELFRVLQLTRDAGNLRRYALQQQASRPLLSGVLLSDAALQPLQAELERCVEADGALRDAASPELARARGQVRDRRRELTTRLQRLVARHADLLAGSYYAERDGRYVLPVRSDSHGTIEGSVLGSSGSGATLYVEPRELVELGNKLRVAEAESDREEARVLAKLSAQAWGLGEALNQAHQTLLEAERLVAMVRWAEQVTGHVFIPTDSGSLDLLSMRHPLLAAGDELVVPSDIRLRPGRALVISGPNAGGKTVALKCLGLAALMARAGVPIPAAAESSVGFYAEVLSDIGDDQSLALSLSTFSGHVRNLAGMLEVAGSAGERRTLILLDELAAGTDPDQGAALATAVLEAMLDAGAAVAVTTHYEALKELAARDARFENASVGFDMQRLAPTFELHLGIPGPSSALAVAQRFGMNAQVVERARALLPEQRLLRDELLASIEQQRQETARALSAAKATELDAQVAKNKLHTEAQAATKRERDTLEREARELSQAVRQARAELQQVSSQLRARAMTQAELKQVEKQIDRAGSQLGVGGRLDQATRGRPGGEPPDAAQLSLGCRVRVLPGGQLGEVAELPVRGKLRVRVGSLTLVCKLSDLRLPEAQRSQAGAQAQAARVAKNTLRNQTSGRFKSPPPKLQLEPSRDEILLRHPGITLDLRGMRVDEALDEVDRFTDSLLQRGESAGFVLHGHGTGALKQAVREHLRSAPGVAETRVAEREEGGDAYTVLWVR